MTDQPQVALQKANAVRSRRKLARERIARGDLTLIEVLQETPAELEGVTVDTLLRWAPMTGVARARRIAGELGTARVGTLTWHQRQALARRLPERLK